MTTASYAYLKRFRFTGLVELTYRDYSASSSYHGQKTERSYSSFEQRYSLGLIGYIYHPKLVSFQTSVTFRRDDGLSGWERKSRNINYQFSASVLPINPVSLSIYGLRTDSTIEGERTAPYEFSSNFYGARLRFAMRNYPSAVLEYSRWDYAVEREHSLIVSNPSGRPTVIRRRIKDEMEINRLTARIEGVLKVIKTRYYITGDLSDHSSPFRSYDGKSLYVTTYTNIRTENNLSTTFRYSDIDLKKLTMFQTDLKVAPIGRLHHSYRYEYITAQTETEKRDLHTFGNYLHYRFSRLVFATANARYSFGKRSDVSEKAYAVNTGLYYGKTIRDFDFSSSYNFSLSKKEKAEEYNFMGHVLGIGLSTGKFRIGKIYANYDFALRKYDATYLSRGYDFEDDFFEVEFEEGDKISAKADAREQRVRMGITGKGPGRAYWNVEAEGRIFDSETENHGTTFWIGKEQWAEKIRHYTFTGDIGYPIGLRGLGVLKAGYTTGTTNKVSVERYYYEIRLNYRLLRNLKFQAWWREDWRNKGWWTGRSAILERAYGWKTREYQAELNYVVRRITLSLEYNVYQVEEGPYETDNRRLYLKASRPF